MKQSICTFILLVVSLPVLQAHSSDSKYENRIAISFSSFGDNFVYYSEDLAGAASYDGDYFLAVGIHYLHPLNRWLELETGAEYARHHILINPNLPPQMDSTPRKAAFSLINIPVTLRANFLRYFFVNGGPFLDIDASTTSPIDSQTGLGAMLGVGMQYRLHSGIALFVNPYVKNHSLLPFGFFNHHERVFEAGFRLGITYPLNR